MTDFKITAPGFYKRRDGRKAEVIKNVVSDIWIVWCQDNKTADTYHESGEGFCSPPESGLTLIAPWSEPLVLEFEANLKQVQHERCNGDASLLTTFYFDKIPKELVAAACRGKRFKIRAEEIV